MKRGVFSFLFMIPHDRTIYGLMNEHIQFFQIIHVFIPKCSPSLQTLVKLLHIQASKKLRFTPKSVTSMSWQYPESFQAMCLLSFHSTQVQLGKNLYISYSCSHVHHDDQLGKSLLFPLPSFSLQAQTKSQRKRLTSHHMRARARQATQISPSLRVKPFFEI
jgi:hypothetical protein